MKLDKRGLVLKEKKAFLEFIAKDMRYFLTIKGRQFTNSELDLIVDMWACQLENLVKHWGDYE